MNYFCHSINNENNWFKWYNSQLKWKQQLRNIRYKNVHSTIINCIAISTLYYLQYIIKAVLLSCLRNQITTYTNLSYPNYPHHHQSKFHNLLKDIMIFSSRWYYQRVWVKQTDPLRVLMWCERWFREKLQLIKPSLSSLLSFLSGRKWESDHNQLLSNTSLGSVDQ